MTFLSLSGLFHCTWPEAATDDRIYVTLKMVEICFLMFLQLIKNSERKINSELSAEFSEDIFSLLNHGITSITIVEFSHLVSASTSAAAYPLKCTVGPLYHSAMDPQALLESSLLTLSTLFQI